MHLVFVQRILYTVPNSLHSILIIQLIKNSISAQNNKVMIVSYFKCFYFRSGYDYIWISTILVQFSLRITKCPAHRKSTRQNSLRSNNNFWFSVIISRRNGSSVVNLTSRSDYSLFLRFI